MKKQEKNPVVCPISPYPLPTQLMLSSFLSLCPAETILHGTVLFLSSVFTSFTFPPEVSALE